MILIFVSYRHCFPVANSLGLFPGSKTNRPTKAIELYELCVHRGRLWSVLAAVNILWFPLPSSLPPSPVYYYEPHFRSHTVPSTRRCHSHRTRLFQDTRTRYERRLLPSYRGCNNLRPILVSHHLSPVSSEVSILLENVVMM